MLFHAGLGCRGGYVGVDIFFVISGFLISSLILKELGDGAFSLIAFWERRIRRILPALTVVVFATIVAGWFLYLPRDFKQIGKSVIGQATLISNIFFMGDTDYFATGSDTKPLLHTWSLAVEEQFYLLYPLLLMLLAQRRKLSLSKTIVCLAVGSFTLCVVASYLNPPAAFYLLPMRAWELMMGAWLAVARGKLSAGERVRETAGWLGVGLVCYGVLFYDRDTRFPGLTAIPPCLGAALIIFSSESKLSRVGRILAFKPVAFIGLISYSLYLWHWPLLAFSKYPAREVPGVGFRVALLAASIVLAILSWRYVETPIHKRRILLKRPQLFGLAGASMATMLGLGLLIRSHDGFPSRFPPEALRYADSWNHRAFMNVISLERAMAGQFVELGSRDTNQPISVLIWGDSHAMAMTPVIDDLCRRFSQRGIQATQISTAPVLGYVSPGAYSLREDSPAFARAVLAFIAQRHVRNVVIAARWSGYPASDSLKTNMLSTIRAIMDLGARVFVVKDVPNPGFDVPRIVALTAAHHGDLEQLGITREKHELSNHELDQTFEQISQMGATVLDPSDYFLNHNGLYGVVRNDQVLFWDSHHLTVEGSRLLAPLFEPVFQTE
jgi:peptidoglycan/LPS O-acetylase OafA/YrhL